jgi:RNA-directed DNA polymerase
VYIPKGKDKLRPLGIPALRDRVVQMAAVLILGPIFEADFLDCSYGFRPGRSTHDATKQIAENLKAGFREVYDADLEGYFDSIPWDKLMAAVRMRVVDRSVLNLIRMWLQAPVIEEDRKTGKRRPPSKPDGGTPQGGVISPLLANIYLHWFDYFFQQADGPAHWANARLVRYADDFVVMARYAGARLRHWIEETLEDRMNLKINREKTTVVNLKTSREALDFLGYRFQRRRCQWRQGHWYYHQEPSPKNLQEERDWLRNQTSSRYCSVSVKDLIEKINVHRRSWGNHFQEGHPRGPFRALNHFTRRRLIKHLKRRSQRSYKKPAGVSWYTHLRDLGLVYL